MKPAPFEYHAPETVADVVGLLAEHGDDAKPLAGGQSLVPMLAMRLTRFEHIVDLNRVDELFGVAADNGGVRIGAMTRQAAVETDAAVAERVPLLHLASPHIGHFQIRNRGTIGGSVAHADPASEYPAVMLALDGTAEIASASGTREVPAAEFFESTFMTAVASDELLTALRFSAWDQPAGFAFDEIARRSGDFALAGAAVGIGTDARGRINRAAVGMLGVGPTPLRASSVEAALTGLAVADADPAEIGRLAADDMDPIGDVHASAEYRRRAGSTLVGRVLADALAQVTTEDGNG
ncbi:FAD binding domain-containing protein [Candidatus Poriferisocius sp.]|uniref:FAD binding domain-containing protein n=1 Tax=Candidatus Poriferisocius sp. TaxID=3101276 RepID=UPI003B01549D